MSRFGLKKMRRKLNESVRTACKFRYIVTYEYLEIKSVDDWKPTELNVLWFRGHRTKSSIKPQWLVQIPNYVTKNTTCTAKWQPPYSVELIVTLYKDVTGKSFKKKDYMFVMEDICGSKRKKLAIFPCNISSYVSMEGETNDLEMEFKSLSKKIMSAKCGLKITCEFIKEGKAIDDDMQSNFSHMSEAEEFSRMSELAEVSDEDYDINRHDDISEEEDREIDETPNNEEGKYDNNDKEQEETIEITNATQPPTMNEPAPKSKPWSKFVADMNSFEWKQFSMLRNPLSSNSKKKKVAEQLKENHEAKLDEQVIANSESCDETEDSHRKQLIRAKSFELLDEDEVSIHNEDDEYDEDNDDITGSTTSLNSDGKPRSTLKGSLRKTLQNVSSKTQKLRTLGPSMDEVKELETKIHEQNATIWNLEKENKELVIENNKLQDDVFSLQKQRDELQTEISELQILVEDIKLRLSNSEAEHKQLKEGEKALLARMNLCGWLCKRGIKGITGRHWRRRWFATDNSGKLYYYKQSNNTTPQGFIDLDKIISVEDRNDDQQDKNMASFCVTVEKRKYELMARDTEEKLKWINALDYLRHWRSHTKPNNAIIDDEKPLESTEPGEELNPFL